MRTRPDGAAFALLTVPSSSESRVDEGGKDLDNISGRIEGCSDGFEGCLVSDQNVSLKQSQENEISSFNEKLHDLVCSAPRDENDPDEGYDAEIKTSDDVRDHRILLSEEQQN